MPIVWSTYDFGEKRRLGFALEEVVEIDGLEEELLLDLGGIACRGAQAQ